MEKIKIGKWLGGGLGWALGGPLGAIIGFAIGSAFDGPDVLSYSETRKVHSGTQTTTGDFAASLLVLSAAVMKSDGKILRSELDYVKRFFVQQFGEVQALQQIQLLKGILERDIPLHKVCDQIKHFMRLSDRLQLLHYLFGISKADGQTHPKEAETISLIAAYLGINTADFNSLKAMYFRNSDSDYRILEISEHATDEEVKKAFLS